ncbi:MAG: peptidylprolyl isomerase [Planctomycetota bacterium]
MVALGLAAGASAHGMEAGPELGEEDGSSGREKVIVAEVGIGRIDLSDVLEIWGPEWERTILRCRRGELDNAASDAHLQEAWEEAIEIAVRDELFYEKARSERQEEIERIAQNLYHAQPGPRSMEAQKTLAAIREEVKQHYERQIQKILDDAVERHVKRVGGIGEAHRVLTQQGLTWKEWKDRLRRKIEVQAYLNDVFPLEKLAEPRPSDIRAYYEEHPEEFVRSGEVVFRHIFISFSRHKGEEEARSLASDIYQRIRKGALSFEEAAREYSEDAASAPFGGMEPLPKEAHTPESLDSTRLAWLSELSTATTDLPVNEIGPPLISEFGCHLIMVSEKIPGLHISFEQAQTDIFEKIKAKEREDLTQNLYLDLRNTAHVNVLRPNYPASHSWEALSKGTALPSLPKEN